MELTPFIDFSNGSIACYVGSKDLYPTKEDFLAKFKTEADVDYESLRELYSEEEILEGIETTYCAYRFYDKDTIEETGNRGGYLEVEKGAKGAFECWCIDV